MIRTNSLFKTLGLSVVVAATIAVHADENASRDRPPGLSFRYQCSQEEAKTIRQFEGKVKAVEGVIYVYATIHMGPANPIKYVDGLPEWRPLGTAVAANKPPETSAPGESAPAGFKIEEQKPSPDGRPQFLETIALGSPVADKFVPAIRFGLGNDRQHDGLASICAWVSDGRIDYFVPFARPNTPYDFKLRVDLKSKRLSAWVSARRDDEWFLVTEDVTLNCPRIQRLKNGTLIVLSDGGGAVDRVGIWRSADEGKTWDVLNTFSPKSAGGSNECYVPDRFLELSDGSWLLSTSCYAWIPGLRNGIKGDTERLDFYRATDNGQTWSFLSGPLASPPHILSEPSTVEIAPGRLVSYARDSNGARPGARFESNDAGKTWKWRDLPFPIVGRKCAGILSDGRVMNTFRSAVGRASLWAWIGDVDDTTGPQPVGAHFNDRRSVGLRDGALHIDNDGARGQFTKYFWPSLESPESTLDLTFEVKVLLNTWRAASVVVPFAGVLRLYPDHVVMAHDPALRADVKPGEFHSYRIESRRGNMKLSIDGKFVWETDKGLASLEKISSWLPVVIPRHSLAFGNEVADSTNWFYVKPTDLVAEVSGYSIWRSFEAITDDPHENFGRRETSSKAGDDRFPDQYQLDHIVEVEASANGHEQGYSGWVQLADGRIFVVNYTDDSSHVGEGHGGGYGIPWICGTFLEPEDLPPAKSKESK